MRQELTIKADYYTFNTYDFPVTSPPSYPLASPVDAAQVWRRRARFRRRIATVLAGLALIFVLILASTPRTLTHGASTGSESPQADPWVVISALGTLAAGIGAIVSGIAAILAVRAAAAATRNPTPSLAKKQTTAATANRPPAKRKKKR